jgi:hypothetical protein
MARMPKGAVASMLEKEATKNTIFFEDFTLVPFDISSRPGHGVVKRYQPVSQRLSPNCQYSAKSP